MFNQDTTTMDYFQGGSSGGGKPNPIHEPDQTSFFILLAATQRDLAISTVRKEWYVQGKHADQLNAAYKKGQVMVFFTVHKSRHIQGAALLTSPCTFIDTRGRQDRDTFNHRVSCEWYRMTELPTSTAIDVAPKLLLPTHNTQFCQEMTSETGDALTKVLWNSPLVTLYESFTGEKEPPTADDIMTDFRCPPPTEVAWPTMPGPGFIFGCNSQTMDECLGRGIFGLPNHMKAAAEGIAPGSSIFLFNVTDRLLFGIFEALTPATMNIEPSAFSKNPKATTSPFPVQIRVRVSLESPPVEDTDQVLNDILRGRMGGRIGPLTHAQTGALASLLAQQCGALQYMTEYEEAVKAGERVVAPPIALPPRKIQKPGGSNSIKPEAD